MRLITLNLNGIRAAERKGFFEWMRSQNPDVVCLQETKAHMKELKDDIFYPAGYHCYYSDALKKGYSGVGILTRRKPERVVTQLGWSHADEEGRYIEADFKTFKIASLYVPSGTSGEDRQSVKFDFMKRYGMVLDQIKNSQYPAIICGDWNIVHKEIDIKNFKGNQKNSGCLPTEREWIDHLFTQKGFIDVFRVKNQEPDQYTWWSNFGKSWEKNVGWRIDYQVATPHFETCVKAVSIYKDQRFSDHAPLIIDYDYEF